MLERASHLPPIQLLVIDNDDAVDTSAALAALNGVAPKSPEVRVCEFPPGFPHSFFSPHDNPDVPRPWLPDFTKAAVELVTGGTFFAPGACPGSPNG